jgi:hypothetical protein
MKRLWDTVIKPVLDKLDLLNKKKPQAELPHVWWVGGGLMSLLPLHAAGEHIPGSTENTISHVISSYSPSLKSLQFVRNKARKSLDVQNLRFLLFLCLKHPA